MSASRPFTARFDGECAVCDGLIEADFDIIVMFDGDAAHAACLDVREGGDQRIVTIGRPAPEPKEHPGNPAREFFD